MKIVVVGEQDFCEVFSFLGIEGIAVDDSQTLIEVLRERLSEKDTLFLISEFLYSSVSKQVEELKSESREAIVIEIPSPRSKGEEKFDLRKMLFSISGVKF